MDKMLVENKNGVLVHKGTDVPYLSGDLLRDMERDSGPSRQKVAHDERSLY